MSSTNRSAIRNDKDYYVTPIPAVIHFLNEFQKRTDAATDWGYILDPCAGGDEENPMSYPEALKQVGVSENKIWTMDIREDSHAQFKGDYLQTELKKKPHVIITNPPFDISLDIIRKALNDVVLGGYVIMLLRLNYFGSDARKPLFEAHMPHYCYVHSKRMSFGKNKNGKNATDSIEYAHFVWRKGYHPKFTELYVI